MDDHITRRGQSTSTPADRNHFCESYNKKMSISDAFASLRAILFSFFASIVLYFRDWKASTGPSSVSASAGYQDLKTYDASTPQSAHEDIISQRGDDLESGLRSPPLICITPATRSPTLVEDNPVFSPSSTATLRGTPVSPFYTPVLTSTVLSPYILNGTGISLSESAKALLSTQCWEAEATPSGLGDNGIPGSGLAISFAAGQQVSPTESSLRGGDVSNPWSHGSNDPIEISNTDSSNEKRSSTTCPAPIFVAEAHTLDSAIKLEQGQVDLISGPIPSPTIERKRPSMTLRRSLIPSPHILGTFAPPFVLEALNSPRQTLPLDPDPEAGAQANSPRPLWHELNGNQETENHASYSPLNATFTSLQDGITDLLGAALANEDARLPSSLSSPEPYYNEFFYEYYCQGAPPLTPILPASPGLDSPSNDAGYTGDVSRSVEGSPVSVSSTSAVGTPATPCEASPSTNTILAGSPSSLVLPTTKLTPSPPKVLIAERDPPQILPKLESCLDMPTVVKIGTIDISHPKEHLTKDFSPSHSTLSSESDNETERSLVLCQSATVVQARRGSIAKPAFMLRVPGTRQSVVLAPVSLSMGAEPGGVQRRSRSVSNDTMTSTSTRSTGYGRGSMLLFAESIEEIEALVADGVNIVSEVRGEETESHDADDEEDEEGDKSNGSINTTSIDEHEIRWLAWPPGIAIEERSPSPDEPIHVTLPSKSDEPESTVSAPPTPATSLTLFNNNHRHQYTTSPHSPTLTRQPTLQSNLRQLVAASRAQNVELPATIKLMAAHREDASLLHSSTIIHMDSTIVGDVPQKPRNVLTFSESRYPPFVLKGPLGLVGINDIDDGGIAAVTDSSPSKLGAMVTVSRAKSRKERGQATDIKVKRRGTRMKKVTFSKTISAIDGGVHPDSESRFDSVL